MAPLYGPLCESSAGSGRRLHSSTSPTPSMPTLTAGIPRSESLEGERAGTGRRLSQAGEQGHRRAGGIRALDLAREAHGQGQPPAPGVEPQHVGGEALARHLQRCPQPALGPAFEPNGAAESPHGVEREIEPDSSPREQVGLSLGGESGNEEQRQQIVVAGSTGRFRADRPAFDGRAAHRFDVDPAPVVFTHDAQPVADTLGGERQRSDRIFARSGALVGALDAVGQGIARELHQRVHQPLGDFAIHWRVAGFDQHADASLLAFGQALDGRADLAQHRRQRGAAYQSDLTTHVVCGALQSFRALSPQSAALFEPVRRGGQSVAHRVQHREGSGRRPPGSRRSQESERFRQIGALFAQSSHLAGGHGGSAGHFVLRQPDRLDSFQHAFQ